MHCHERRKPSHVNVLFSITNVASAHLLETHVRYVAIVPRRGNQEPTMGPLSDAQLPKAQHRNERIGGDLGDTSKRNQTRLFARFA